MTTYKLLTVSDWCALADLQPSTYYALAPWDRPLSVHLNGELFISESPKEFWLRMGTPRPMRDLQLIPREAAMQLTGLSRDEIQEQMNAGTFPRCTREGMFERGEVLGWVQRALDERDMVKAA